jgi:hypothetical protein
MALDKRALIFGGMALTAAATGGLGFWGGRATAPVPEPIVCPPPPPVPAPMVVEPRTYAADPTMAQAQILEEFAVAMKEVGGDATVIERIGAPGVNLSNYLPIEDKALATLRKQHPGQISDSPALVITLPKNYAEAFDAATALAGRRNGSAAVQTSTIQANVSLDRAFGSFTVPDVLQLGNGQFLIALSDAKNFLDMHGNRAIDWSGFQRQFKEFAEKPSPDVRAEMERRVATAAAMQKKIQQQHHP